MGESTSKAGIEEILRQAAQVFDRAWDDLPRCSSEIVDLVPVAQGMSGMPEALRTYWTLAGHNENGLWREFSRCGGFSVLSGVRARVWAMETAIDSGSLQSFRASEPLIVFNDLPGGEVFWCPFDADTPEEYVDPPVWMLSEELGSDPVEVSDSFTSFIASAVDQERELRSIY